MARKIRCGVVGLGVGRTHIRGYQSHPRAEVVAIADLDGERLEKVSDEYGVANRYRTAAEMLKKEKLHVVSVATPNKFHKPLTIAALNAGCHVLCEKPMAMNTAEARKMLAASRKAKKRLMIHFSYRFTGEGYALKREVDAGTFGKIYFGHTIWHRRRGFPGFGGWFSTKSLAGGGPLIDLGVHRLDLALWLMGYPKPEWVMGSTYDYLGRERIRKSRGKFDVEDLAAGFITFRNGASLVLEASWAANVGEHELMETRLLGTKAGLVHRNVGEGYKFEAVVYVERDGVQYDMKVHPPVPAVHGAMYHFVESILRKKRHIATGEEGVIVMQILDAVYKSARTGRPVRMK